MATEHLKYGDCDRGTAFFILICFYLNLHARLVAATLDNTAVAGTTELHGMSNRGNANTRLKDEQSCFLPLNIARGRQAMEEEPTGSDLSDISTKHSWCFWNWLPKSPGLARGMMTWSEGVDGQTAWPSDNNC